MAIRSPACVPILLLATLLSCGGAPSRGRVSAAASFEVVGFSVAPGERLPLNRPLEITFSEDVDLATVTPSTLRIRAIGSQGLGGESGGGEPAAGTYALPSSRVVRFTPACPTDGEGPGLRAGTRYSILVPGQAEPGPVLRSSAGTPLASTAGVPFETAFPGAPDRYDDPVAGPPEVVFRDQGSSERAATYLEIGLDDLQRVYFERDAGGQVELPLGFVAPLNRASLVPERVAWITQIDQPIDPSSENLGPERVRLEGLAAGGVWTALATRTEIVANCQENGATVRVTPIGVLPQDSTVRLVLDAGFRDLAGEARTSAALVALAPIATAYDPGTTTPGDAGDQRFEAFSAGGEGADSLEDTSFDDGSPKAAWGGGLLSASTSFDGTGGPNGDFDWHIPAGVELILDTTLDTIVGGPNGVPTTTETVVAGVVDVRNFYLPASSRLIVSGPNPLTMLASGWVLVEGEISARGGSNPGVETINTTNIPEPGAQGQASGGDGGTGSYLTTESTPRGGPGFGPFQVPERGGEGGETSYADTGKIDRRGAGGGGGRYGPDVRYDHDDDGLDHVRCQTLVGLDVERGAMGGPGGLGAESQSTRAQGGQPAPSAFEDLDPQNDFFGILRRAGTGEIVHGELARVQGGSGGGAGGDAVNSDSFPLIPFSNQGDEKGAGGGGGGGAIHVLAIGPITIAEGGSIAAEGGTGNGGENTSYFDRVGGGSGGGAGGAIVLESASSIEVRGVAQDSGDFYRDDKNKALHFPRPLSALGGQGGAGNQSWGGANENGPTGWACDRVPFDHFEGIPDVPPQQTGCYQAFPDKNDPDGGPVVGAGGDGGPGLVQLHVPDPATDLSFPDAAGDLTKVSSPPPVGWDIESAAFTGSLLPSFGPRSVARSRWIPLGLARHDPSGVDDPVLLFFGGTAPDGRVRAASGAVLLEPSLLGPAVVQSPPLLPYIDPTDPYRIVFDASTVAGFDDVYERNPALLEGFTVRLSQVADPALRRDFTVALGDYDPALDTLGVTVAANDGALTDFAPGGDVQAELVPRSFQVFTGGVADALAARIRITFDATRSDGLGRPDDALSYSATNGAFAGDVSLLNQQTWDFVRFQVDFELPSPLEAGVPLPALGHLRVPFRF